MARIDEGFLTIKLGDNEYTLNCNLGVLRAINAQYGGALKARQELSNQNFDAYVMIIKWGAGIDGKAAMKKLNDDVYAAGLGGDLQAELYNFLMMLSNGGKPFDIKSLGSAGTEDSDAGN